MIRSNVVGQIGRQIVGQIVNLRRIGNPPADGCTAPATRGTIRRRLATRLTTCLTIALLPLCAGAHDIPNDVTVQVFLKPAGQHLNLLVRVPLRAMRDVVFPEQGPGYLDIGRTEPLLPDACTQWLSVFIELYEDQTRLPFSSSGERKPRVSAARISLEADKSFESYEQAAAHITGPSLPAGTNVVWNQTLLDVWFDYPIRSDRSAFSIHPELVRLDPSWRQAALRFIRQGFLHILDGTDHLLFLLCLVIPFRRFRSQHPVVTAFTVAHSITLIASAYDLGPDALWFPPLIETLIAVSIVYMALENIVGGASLHRRLHRRWIIAFAFGLVHGFGFSFSLRQMLQFAGSHLLASLLSFNVGVELGQLLVLLLLIPLLELCFRFVVAERMGTIILSALVAHTGWHWMLDRAGRLSLYRFQWPVLTTAVVVSAMRWGMLAAIVAAGAWLVRRRKTTP